MIIDAFLVTGQSADFIVEVVARDMENYGVKFYSSALVKLNMW